VGQSAITSLFSGPSSGDFFKDVAFGALRNAAAQGLSVAVGLRSKFDFAGVAAAGLGAAAGTAVGRTRFAASPGKFGERVLTNTASALANAATRSVLDGTDFGDNILASLPDVIGQTVGSLVAERALRSRGGKTGAQQERATGEGVYAGAAVAPSQAPGLRYLVNPDEDAPAIVPEQETVDVVVTATRETGQSARKSRSFFDLIDSVLKFSNLGGHNPHKRSASAFSLISYIVKRADYATNQAYYAIDRVDQYYQHTRTALGNYVPATLLAPGDAGEAALRTVARAVPGLIGTAAHPQQALFALAGGIDRLILDDTSLLTYTRGAYTTLTTNSIRQNANLVGEIGGNIALIVAPEAAAGRLGTAGRLGETLRIDDIAPAAESATARAARLGSEGEQAVGLFGPKVGIRVPGAGNIRFPDNLTTTTLTEVKNVASQGLTKQLRDYITISQKTGRTFDLYVRPSTYLTPKLEAAIQRGEINLHYIPGAK
jgi:hypothetical protein